jgi:tetratricopeptide (TPR) repeat protein
MVHVYAGNLLMTTGAYHDSIKAFMNADTVKPTAVAAFQRARCYCALTDIDSAVDEIESALLFNPNETLTLLDKECLIALKDLISALKDQEEEKKEGKKPNKLLDSRQEMEKVLETLTSLISAVQTNDIKSLKRKDSPLNIQTIPNVHRIKIEKQLVAKEILFQDKSLNDMSSLSIDISQTVTADDMKGISCLNNYYENIFSIEDFTVYRGICHFYLQNYQDAQVNFKKCI